VQRARFDLSAIRHRLEPALGLGLVTSRGELHKRQELSTPTMRVAAKALFAPSITLRPDRPIRVCVERAT